MNILRMLRRNWLVALALCTCVLLGAAQPLGAQSPPEMGRLAKQATKEIAKTDGRRILMAPLTGCFGEPAPCAQLDAALHAEMGKSIPSVQFISTEDAAKHLEEHGFLSMDAYLGALDDVASDAGADLAIDEDFQRKRNGCELHLTITDAKHLFEIREFVARTSCGGFPDKPKVLLTDPATGISLLLPIPPTSKVPSGIRMPSCLRCTEPPYPGGARSKRIQGSVRIVATITDQGTVTDAVVISAVEDSFAAASLRALNGWLLLPAAGPDGKRFPVRTEIDVTFKLL